MILSILVMTLRECPTFWHRVLHGVYLDSALMDMCLMILSYLADLFWWCSVNSSSRFPCNPFDSGGFILQTAVTIGHSGYQLAHGGANQQFYASLFRSERGIFHPPAAICAGTLLLCISLQSCKWWMITYKKMTLGARKKIQKYKASVNYIFMSCFITEEKYFHFQVSLFF